MKKHPNVKRSWTFILPTETMPAVNTPKAMNQFMRELQDIVIDLNPGAFVGLCGDYVKKEVRVTFRYYVTAAQFADMWFRSRAKVLAEMGRRPFQDEVDDIPF